jgi:glycosyltransferase involved in cell wall biosynthesis
MKTDSRYLVWVGSVFDEFTVLNNKAVSPAANNWQKGLITGLESQGLSVITLAHLYEPIFPKGRLWISSNDAMLHSSVKGEMISYCNLPILKNKLLAKEYINRLDLLCKIQGKPSSIIIYNPYPYCVEVGMYAQKKLQIPTICILADGVEKDMELAELSTGVVFLSWDAYQNSDKKQKFHLDGGVEKFNFSDSAIPELTESSKLKILYTGGISQHGGIEFLLREFSHIKIQNIELWISGSGKNKDLEQVMKQDSRIKYFGLVTEEKLQELYKNADVFVNPRPSELALSRFNFPSKIFQYLSYGKPIISTWTGGISPDYQDLLVVIDESPFSLSKAVEEILRWDIEKYQNVTDNIKQFVETDRLWRIQSKKMISWMRQNIFMD